MNNFVLWSHLQANTPELHFSRHYGLLLCRCISTATMWSEDAAADNSTDNKDSTQTSYYFPVKKWNKNKTKTKQDFIKEA